MSRPPSAPKGNRNALLLRAAAPVVLIVLVGYVLIFADHPKHWQVVLAWIVLVLAVLNFALLGLLQVMRRRLIEQSGIRPGGQDAASEQHADNGEQR